MTRSFGPPEARSSATGLRLLRSRRSLVRGLRAAGAGGGGEARAASGFTLLEVSVVCVILAVALVMLSGTIASTSQVVPQSAERFHAAQAAADVIERMHNTDLDELFASFNSNPADDPGGPGTAFGSAFDVEGLTPIAGDADGRVGTVLLPELENMLREDLEDSLLGLPRDLNSDLVVDDLDHASDWVVLPVIVRVEWASPRGDRSIDIPTMFARVP